MSQNVAPIVCILQEGQSEVGSKSSMLSCVDVCEWIKWSEGALELLFC